MNNDLPPSEEKRTLFTAAVERGIVQIQLDTTRPGVVVPEAHFKSPILRLNFSRRFPPHDLQIDAWGLRQTLSFDGAPFPVAVPWSAIFAILGPAPQSESWLFPQAFPIDVFETEAQHAGLDPEELTEYFETRRGGALRKSPPRASPPSPRPPPRPTLTVVPPLPPEEKDAEGGPPPPEPPPTAPRPGGLRIVK